MLLDLYICQSRDVTVLLAPSTDEYAIVATPDLPLHLFTAWPLGQPHRLSDHERSILGPLVAASPATAILEVSNANQAAGLNLGLWHERANAWSPPCRMQLGPTKLLSIARSLARLNKLQSNRKMAEMLAYSISDLGQAQHGVDSRAFAGAVMQSIFRLSPLLYRHLECLGAACALTRLMRENGFPAQLNIGVRPFPFEAHAWVSLDGDVVAEDPRLPEQLHRLMSIP